jgi:MFS family permease
LTIAIAAAVSEASDISIIPLVVVLAFCAGAAYAATIVSAQTALFENMPEAVRGRVFGVLASIVSAASLIPILIAGPLADATSGPAVIAFTAACVIGVSVWSAALFGPRRKAAASVAG